MNKLQIKDAVFYVMSGTGNTYRMGCWAAEILRRKNVHTKVVMTDAADFENDVSQPATTLFGLLFPTHGFMPPWSMIKFLFKVPKGRGAAAICGATRGAFRIGPLHIPGASGFATFFAAVLMLLKGYRVRAVFSLDMPANLTNFHWGLHPKNIEKISSRSKWRLSRLLPLMLSGRIILFTLNNLWELLWCALILWLFPIFPILYLVIARMFMAKVMFASNRCIGCGRCARFCPNHAILMKSAGKKKRPFWTYHCENCLRCMGFCKQKAVEAGHSWALLLYVITSVPVSAALLAWLNQKFVFIPVIHDYWTLGLLNFFYILPALFLSYYLFWYLIQIPAVNTLFTMSTLTHYYRRYHQPETRLKDLAGRKTKKEKGEDIDEL